MALSLGRRAVPMCKTLSQLNVQQLRWMSAYKMNTVVLFVPQQQAWVIERFGKFNQILEPGLRVILPIVDSIKYAHSLKEIAMAIPEQHAITADNVTLRIDGVLYVKIRDPYKASYGVDDPEFAITQLAQTSMRSEIGKISLDQVFKERELLNVAIVNALNLAAESWGMECLRYEIKNIELPRKVMEAMQMMVEAERKKRANILESEGVKSADINVAEGKKQSRILNSEANRIEQVNEAMGEADATVAKARAKAISVALIAQALSKNNGMNAVSMKVAESYVEAFGKLAKKTNTVLLPANTGDVSSMVSQAMAIYNKLNVPPSEGEEPEDQELTDQYIAEEIDKLKALGQTYKQTDSFNQNDTTVSLNDDFLSDKNADSSAGRKSGRKGRKED